MKVEAVEVCGAGGPPSHCTLLPDGTLLHKHSPTLTHSLHLFLPDGFPHSVTPDYLPFQAWDSLQAASSYLRGIMATQALLESVGVGTASASPLAAALTWVMRDGASMLGSLAFVAWGASRFALNVRFYRLFADVANDVGLTLNMVSPLLPKPLFLPVACLASLCMGLCGVVAGSTRAVITTHFARSNNIADVASKESSQETAVTLLGMLLGLFISSFDLSKGQAWVFFLLLTAFHVYANWRAVSVLRFRTLNASRADVAMRTWLSTNKVPALEAVNEEEPLLPWSPWSPPLPRLRHTGRRVFLQFGCGAVAFGRCVAAGTRNLAAVMDEYEGEEYLAAACAHGGDCTIAIGLKRGVTVRGRLQAYLQAVLTRQGVAAGQDDVAAVLREARRRSAAQMDAFLAALEGQGYDVEGSEVGGTTGWRLNFRVVGN